MQINSGSDSNAVIHIRSEFCFYIFRVVELGEKFGESGQIADAAWPVWDECWLIDDEVEIVLQVNGKVRDKMIVLREASREEVEAQARGSVRIAEWTAGKEIRKVIVVPGKLVNLVVV